jgi:hypothetical protein
VMLRAAADAYRRAENEARGRMAAAEGDRARETQRAEAESARQAFEELRTKAAAAGAEKGTPDILREALDIAAQGKAQYDRGDFSAARNRYEAAIAGVQRSINALTAERQDWEGLRNSREIAALQSFLQKYPTGLHAGAASQRIEQVDWESVDRKDPAALKAFLQKNPGSSFSAQASAEIARLEQSRGASADRQGIQAALEAYVGAFQRMDANALQAAWPDIPNDVFSRAQQAFRDAKSITLSLVPLADPVLNGDSAVVACRRELKQQYRTGPTPPSRPDTVTISLRKRGGAWVIESIQ